MRGLLLAGLLDGPAHGYELMQRLEQSTNGTWRPSPGSVYPMLQQLEDEGLARSDEHDGRKVYDLTAIGREQADPKLLENFATKTANVTSAVTLITELKQLSMAAKQVAMAGDPDVAEKAVEIVRGARQSLYRLLADQ
jgi:DNA-binding PadR family transcriptional regulator